MKPTVIYHSADYDGIFCREIARKFLPDAELIGWNFVDPPVSLPVYDRHVYVLDLPVDKVFARALVPGSTVEWPGLVWIDHHKTSIDTHPSDIPGYRIDGVAACRLVWQWFANGHLLGENQGFPTKQDFIDRKVSEPLAVRLAGEYDVLDKRDSRAETFQYGLSTMDLNQGDWDDLLSIKVHSVVSTLLDYGTVAQLYSQKIDADLVRGKSYRLKWEGLNFLALNTGRFNSLTFTAMDVPETGHDALMGYMFNGKCWTVSLYHAKHRTDLDLSEIAKKYGGGGHRGACGMTFTNLPPFLKP